MQHFTPEGIAEHRRIMDARENDHEYKVRKAKEFGIKPPELKEHELPYWESRDHS
jgi:hypothetical protein